MVIALDASSPAAVYGDATATTSLVTASFTPPNNAVVLAKVLESDGGGTSTTPTGLTFTSRVNIGTNNATTRVALYSAIGAGSAVTVTAAFGGNAQARALIVEVWTGAQLAGSPAIHSLLSGTGAPSDSLTTAAAGSVVSWMSGDWAAIALTGKTYRSSATETASHFVTGLFSLYTAYQSAASAGAQTYGLTAPTGQTFTMASIELQDAGAAVTLPPDYMMAPLRPR